MGITKRAMCKAVSTAYRTLQIVSTKLKDRIRLADVVAGFNVSGSVADHFSLSISVCRLNIRVNCQLIENESQCRLNRN